MHLLDLARDDVVLNEELAHAERVLRPSGGDGWEGVGGRAGGLESDMTSDVYIQPTHEPRIWISDSSIVLISRGGIPRSMGSFPEI